jgi:putative ABC transport system permease protein
MPVFRGRAFSSRDDHTAPGVAIVNNTFAHRLAPDGNVLGRRLRVARAAALPEYEIVGVVADARSTGTSTEIWNEVYIPATQSTAGVMYVVAQVLHDDGSLTRAIRGAVAAVLPNVPIGYDQVAKPLPALMMEAVARPRFSATLISALSATALVVAAIGIVGLVSYTVSSRRREFGVRAALGARPRDLTWTAMRPVLAYCVIGLLMGVLAGVFSVPLFKSQIHDTVGFDGRLFVAAAGLTLALAALAAYVPGRLAGRTDPSQLLRQG